MQVVIDINQRDYENICFSECVPNPLQYKIGDAIANGTLLPKRHGRLIDADELKKSVDEYSIAYPQDREEDMRNTIVEYISNDIDEALIVLEADKKGRD